MRHPGFLVTVYADRVSHERRFPFRFGTGELVVRWRDTSMGPVASLHFNGRPLAVTWQRTVRRNGTTTIEPRPEADDEAEDADLMPPVSAPALDEFPARGLVDDIDTLSVEPARRPGLTGLAALGASLDPATWRTHRFVMSGGHSASGVIYNSSVTSTRSIRIEIDTKALTATYSEHSDFDDG